MNGDENCHFASMAAAKEFRQYHEYGICDKKIAVTQMLEFGQYFNLNGN